MIASVAGSGGEGCLAAAPAGAASAATAARSIRVLVMARRYGRTGRRRFPCGERGGQDELARRRGSASSALASEPHNTSHASEFTGWNGPGARELRMPISATATNEH